MSQSWARGFYSGKAWLRCRAEFIAKRRAIDGGMCMDCGERLGYIAHHWPVMLTAETVNDPDIALNHANLRWVCKECHDKYPGHGVAPSLTPLIRFDADGDPIPP